MPKRRQRGVDDGQQDDRHAEQPPSKLLRLQGDGPTTTETAVTKTTMPPAAAETPSGLVDVSAAELVRSSASTGRSASDKSPKKRVRFDGVTVYYFHRSQGFSCIPTTGGSTLGMCGQHHTMRRLSLCEHENEQLYKKRVFPLNGGWNNSDIGSGSIGPSNESADINENENENEDEDEEEDDDDEEENEEDGEQDADRVTEAEPKEESEQLHPGQTFIMDPNNWASGSSDCQDASSWKNVGFTVPEEYIFQPLGSRERRTVLRRAGVDLDREEKSDCHEIRVSRQICGCDCRGHCVPETCACVRDNIKCQVDRPSFPCGCTKHGCMNPNGRVEFNPVRVRTHYLHTMMRLKMETRYQTELPTSKHIRFVDDAYVDYAQHQPTENGYKDSSAFATSRSAESAASVSRPFLGFQNMFGCSGVNQQTTTVCNERSYWRLDAGTSHVALTPTADGFVDQLTPSSTSWDNMYRHGTENCGGVAAGSLTSERSCAYASSLLAPQVSDGISVGESEQHTEDSGFDENVYAANHMADSSGILDSRVATDGAAYSLTALYPRRRADTAQFGGPIVRHSIQEFQLLDVGYMQQCESSTVMYDESESGEQDSGLDEEDARNGVGSADASSADGSTGPASVMNEAVCAPVSPPPRELGAVLKKSICETALA